MYTIFASISRKRFAKVCIRQICFQPFVFTVLTAISFSGKNSTSKDIDDNGDAEGNRRRKRKNKVRQMYRILLLRLQYAILIFWAILFFCNELSDRQLRSVPLNEPARFVVFKWPKPQETLTNTDLLGYKKYACLYLFKMVFDKFCECEVLENLLGKAIIPEVKELRVLPSNLRPVPDCDKERLGVSGLHNRRLEVFISLIFRILFEKQSNRTLFR